MGSKSENKFISLMICDNLIEANLIKGKLSNEGIKSFCTNENFTSLFPNYFGMLGSGVHIFIAQKDFDKARKLLDLNINKNQFEISCPDCGSQNITFRFGRGKFRKWSLVILSLLLVIPFGNIRKNYFCKDCKCEF